MSTSRLVAWMIWVVASVFYAYQYVLRVMPSIMLDDIMNHFHIGAGTMGQFSGVYYVGYSLMHLPLGMMLDRFGPKRMMTGCILLTVVGLLPLVYADNWVYPILGRLLVGMGSSAAVLGLFKIIRMSFSEARFSRMLSFSVTIGLLGAIYGGGPVSYMKEVFGYVSVVQLFAFVGVGLAFFTYLIVPEMERTRNHSVVASVKQVLGNWKVLGTCFFAGLMVGPLEGFTDVWGAAFLRKVYGFESSLAASLPSVIFIGMCFGGPLLSLIAEKVGYLATIMWAGVAMTVCFSVLLGVSLSSTWVSVIFFVIGLACAYQILAIYQASTYVGEHVAGLTTALANMIIMLFGYAFHSVMGAVITYCGGMNSPEALLKAVLVIPMGLSIGSVGYLYLLKSSLVPEASFGSGR